MVRVAETFLRSDVVGARLSVTGKKKKVVSRGFTVCLCSTRAVGSTKWCAEEAGWDVKRGRWVLEEVLPHHHSSRL